MAEREKEEMSVAVTITLIICATILLLSVCSLIKLTIEKDTLREVIREEISKWVTEMMYLDDLDEEWEDEE